MLETSVGNISLPQQSTQTITNNDRSKQNGIPIPVLDKRPKIATSNKRKWSAMEHNIDKRIGKLNLLMCPRQEALQHPAAVKLLDYAISGCPADCGKSWDRDHIEKAMIRGAHRSALAPLASEELLKKTVEKVRNGFAKIIRYGDIKDRLPENLKISPVAMIPHKSRKSRCILDLSFCLKIDGTKMPSVNSSTTQTAPQNSMDELGRVLERLGSFMASAPESSPNVSFSKLDIADGF